MPREPNEIIAGGRLGRRSLVGRCLSGVLLLVFCWAPPCRAALVDYLQLPQIFPEHDLVVVRGERPEWKKEWDNGRRQVRSGDYREAAESYRRLLASKGNVEEARWELALVLARLDEWEKARAELELLAEAAPDNIDYLSVLGLALRHTGQSGRALEIFSKVRGRSPENFTALVGEALGLAESGRKREALPLIQSVAAKYPDDRDLSLAVVGLASDLGQLETARKYLVPLVASRKADLELVAQAARIHDALGREKEGCGYWERVIALDPANREARERLVRYYDDLGQPDKVLIHLQALWENDQKNLALLSRICRIYFKTAPFADGLPFYKQYLQIRPDDLDFIRSLINHKTATAEAQFAFMRWLSGAIPDGLGILQGFAAELVAAGNPGEAVALLEKLAKVAPERVEVLRALDPLLEKLGRQERLLEVLEAINGLAPGDQALIGRLARLRVGRGELREGLAYYNLLEQNGYAGSDLFVERSALHERLHQPFLALADYEKLLAVAPERDEVRRRSLILAGEIGEVRVLVRLAEGLEKIVAPAERVRQMLLLADSLAKAGDSERAAQYYQRVMAAPEAEKLGGHDLQGGKPSLALALQARLGLVDLYRQGGQVYEAEQVLRQGLLAEAGQADLLLRLFELSLAAVPADLDSATIWLEQYSLHSQGHPNLLVVMQARLLTAAGEFPEAEALLRGLLEEMGAAEQASGPDAQVLRQVGLALVETLAGAGKQAAAEQQCLAMLQVRDDQEVLARLARIYLAAGESEAADKLVQRLIGSETDDLRLLALAELFQKMGLAAGQFVVADRVLADWPDSFRAGLLRGEALRRKGEISPALAAAEALGEKFPGVMGVALLKVRSNYQGGFYRQAADQCEELLVAGPERLDLQLLRVRCALALGDLAAATRLIQALYPVEGEQYLKTLFADAGLPLPLPRQKRSLWQILTFQSLPFDLVGEVLSARGFYETTPERPRINALVSARVARLRWEKNFRAVLTGAEDAGFAEGKLAKKK